MRATTVYLDAGTDTVYVDYGAGQIVKISPDQDPTIVFQVPGEASPLVNEDDIDSSDAYDEGYSEGYDSGYSDGEGAGYSEYELEQEYDRGYAEGQAELDGEYDRGFSDGVASVSEQGE